jgi:glyoxylase I family protein
MNVTNVLSVAMVSDFEQAMDWYERLFDRPPDQSPMQGSAVWQLTPAGGLQLNHVPDQAGGGAVVIGVADVDAFVASLEERGLRAEAETEPTGQFRLAAITDPARNTITFAQDLTNARVNQPSGL